MKGLKAVWISRADTDPVMGVTAYTDIKPDWEYETMAQFSSAVAEARA